VNGLAQQLNTWFGGSRASAVKQMVLPVFIIMMLAMMVLPLPGFLLDLLFTFNIALALVIIMVSARMVKPLDFSALPNVLMLATLLRLSLNVASTRLVLMEGHTGPGAAGQVIEAFGHFIIGGNFAVGLIVFAILVTINFVVVTKGAERIAEVGARFALDAMPGKQMAIDADLNAGLIDEKMARQRRLEVAEEADFFGSMDGASKYVRGDAMAGLLILFITIVGGFAIGMISHSMSAGEAAQAYVTLAVGDALGVALADGSSACPADALNVKNVYTLGWPSRMSG
jgi:flagellar biosynthesis protein FlhA